MSQPNWKYVNRLAGKHVMFEGDDHRMYEVEAITQESASNYLYVLTGQGMRPGSFTTNLIMAAMSADLTNLARLSHSFPEITQVAALINRAGESGHSWVAEKAAGLH